MRQILKTIYQFNYAALQLHRGALYRGKTMKRRLKFLDIPATPPGAVLLALILGAALIAGWEVGEVLRELFN